ncbi:hypothetical protein F2Q69_00011305 [Brassica cretica]|uniref:Uncharacterized protein n=2 Tax=Brassica cretica TaxID=69181 RepID=A0A8S9QYP9_BRACR|nr:hypothetical protein F2Q69_00011305 [Brassica cretica]KAF3576926.1 hypothetical protein DY000_02029522 [Brassica cretica]
MARTNVELSEETQSEWSSRVNAMQRADLIARASAIRGDPMQSKTNRFSLEPLSLTFWSSPERSFEQKIEDVSFIRRIPNRILDALQINAPRLRPGAAPIILLRLTRAVLHSEIEESQGCHRREIQEQSLPRGGDVPPQKDRSRDLFYNSFGSFGGGDNFFLPKKKKIRPEKERVRAGKTPKQKHLTIKEKRSSIRSRTQGDTDAVLRGVVSFVEKNPISKDDDSPHPHHFVFSDRRATSRRINRFNPPQSILSFQIPAIHACIQLHTVVVVILLRHLNLHDSSSLSPESVVRVVVVSISLPSFSSIAMA